MKKTLVSFLGLLTAAITVQGQILLSGGLTYSQNFNSLSNSGVVTTTPWTDNSTLPGWYATRGLPTPQATWTGYRVSGGENNSGSIYSYGTNGVNALTDRALGSLASGTPGTNAIGLRIQNDTADLLGNITISYTGEQWRNGSNANAQVILAFGYGVNAAFTPVSAVTNDPAYTTFTALNFVSPVVDGPATPLDGNAPANQVSFSNIVLTGVTLNPGQEIVLRWFDVNNTGNDHGGGIDDFSISFSAIPEPASVALFGLGALALLFRQRRK